MIIPKITLAAAADPIDLVDQLKHWSLFGSVALTEVEFSSIAPLEAAIKIVGGMVDLIIELAEPNNDDALTLLNAGASLILCAPHDLTKLEEVPAERLVHGQEDDSSDQAIPPGVLVTLNQPTATRIAELEMARIDTLIEVSQLQEHPQMIADFFQAVLVTDRPDGLWATVIVDPLGVALGLAYSNYESLLYAIEHRCGTYWSRSRDGLWIKG